MRQSIGDSSSSEKKEGPVLGFGVVRYGGVKSLLGGEILSYAKVVRSVDRHLEKKNGMLGQTEAMHGLNFSLWEVLKDTKVVRSAMSCYNLEKSDGSTAHKASVGSASQ